MKSRLFDSCGKSIKLVLSYYVVVCFGFGSYTGRVRPVRPLVKLNLCHGVILISLMLRFKSSRVKICGVELLLVVFESRLQKTNQKGSMFWC